MHQIHHRTCHFQTKELNILWGGVVPVASHVANHQLLIAVPRYRLNTYGRRAISVAGQATEV